MKKFILHIISFFAIVFGGIAVVNYFVDPGNVYSSKYVETVFKELHKGPHVTNVGNMNERVFKKKFIESFAGEKFDFIILGSSRIMTLSSDAFDGYRILNLGLSGCTLQDIMALIQILKENGIKYENVIFDLDPTYLNPNNKDNRWESIEDYYMRFNGQCFKDKIINWTTVKNLFSPSYFKSSLKSLPQLLKGSYSPIATRTIINDGFTIRNDGSISYDRKYRETPQVEIDASAQTWNHGSYDGFSELDTDKGKMFEELVNYLYVNVDNITFFECPYHPVVYNRLIRQNGFNAAVEYFKRIGGEYKINIIGKYNPSEAGFSNVDFYDGAHLRKESEDKMFSNNSY